MLHARTVGGSSKIKSMSMYCCPRQRHIVLVSLFIVTTLGLPACHRSDSFTAVTHLQSPDPQKPENDVTAGDQTRPAVELAAGESLNWTLPAGPRRLLRMAYVEPVGIPNRKIATLTATLSPVNAPNPAPAQAQSVFARSTEAWKPWEFTIPEFRRPRVLTLAYRPVQGQHDNHKITVALPSLSRPASHSPRIFVLFDVDALRRDHLSIYGYNQSTTPNIDDYFKNKLIWDNAFSNIPWTLPSHVTIFSSTLPNEHGVGERVETIPRNLPLLAQILSKNGFRTIAVTNGGWVDPSWGFGRGFDVYIATPANVEDEVTLAGRLLRHYKGEPIFLFFHTYQVHNYAPDAQSADALFGSTTGLGPLWTQSPYHTLGILIRKFGKVRVRHWLINRYDAALRRTDDAFRRLSHALAKTCDSRSVAVLLTSDHGEEIFDRDYAAPDPAAGFGHGAPYLYDEYLRVPLLLSVPWWNQPHRDIRNDVSLADIAPTILDILNIPSPRTFQGKTLYSRNSGFPSRNEIIFSKGPRYDALAVRLGNYKMIRRTAAPIHATDADISFGRVDPLECYNVSADPGERRMIPCTGPWADTLQLEVERYLSRQYPGSLVFRLDPAAGTNNPREGLYALKVTGRDGPPQVSSFGLGTDARLWTGGAAVFAQFKVSSAPVWIALQPAVATDAMDVQLFAPSGTSSLRSAAEMPLSRESTWTELLWHGRKTLAGTYDVFTTRPSTLDLPPGDHFVLANWNRLRSLGYLTGGNVLTFPAPQRPDSSGRHPPFAFPAPGKTIRIEVRAGRPPWKSPAITAVVRRIAQVLPSHTVAGASFRLAADGLCQLEIKGTGFTPADRVYWDSERLTTFFISPKILRAEIPPAYLIEPASVPISILDPLNPQSLELHKSFTIQPRPAK